MHCVITNTRYQVLVQIYAPGAHGAHDAFATRMCHGLGSSTTVIYEHEFPQPITSSKDISSHTYVEGAARLLFRAGQHEVGSSALTEKRVRELAAVVDMAMRAKPSRRRARVVEVEAANDEEEDEDGGGYSGLVALALSERRQAVEGADKCAVLFKGSYFHR